MSKVSFTSFHHHPSKLADASSLSILSRKCDDGIFAFGFFLGIHGYVWAKIPLSNYQWFSIFVGMVPYVLGIISLIKVFGWIMFDLTSSLFFPFPSLLFLVDFLLVRDSDAYNEIIYFHEVHTSKRISCYMYFLVAFVSIYIQVIFA